MPPDFMGGGGWSLALPNVFGDGHYQSFASMVSMMIVAADLALNSEAPPTIFTCFLQKILF
jgi:hypothetical protein